jgi:hypothetical protein
MRRLKTFIVMFVITAGGTFLTFETIRFFLDDPYLNMSKFGDVFTGYRPKYRRGASLNDKAAEDWKAGYINRSLDEVVPYVLVSLVCFLSLGIVAGFKVYSGTWWRSRRGLIMR